MSASNSGADPRAAANGKRRRGFIVLAGVVAIGGIVWGAYWLLYARHFEATDDAYVSGDVVQITSQVPGTITEVHVDDTQRVKPGELLVELDPADAKVAQAAAAAELARTVRQVRGLYAQGAQLRAQIAERESALAQAKADYDRRKNLTSDGAVSREELAHVRDAVTQIQAALAAAREQLQTTLVQTEGTTVATHPLVLAACAKLRDAALALSRSHITAPVAGVVARRTAQVGSRVASGAPLMALVPLDDVWVDANFKEVQLARMREGQPVEVHADLYGGGVDYHGRLAGLAAGSGSAFALLPAQNASGNWIKIVQRVPVRVVLDPKELAEHPLRVGLSISAKVDVRDQSGAVVAVPPRQQPARPSDLADESAVDAQIAKIIEENSGSGAGAAAP